MMKARRFRRVAKVPDEMRVCGLLCTQQKQGTDEGDQRM
jgi:hypothetical protein